MSRNSKVWVGILALLLILEIVFAGIAGNPARGFKSSREYTIPTPTQSVEVGLNGVKVTTDNATPAPEYSPVIKELVGMLPLVFSVMIVLYVVQIFASHDEGG